LSTRSHWSPRYVFDKARAALYEWTHPDYPWLTRQANRLLEEWLRPSHVGLEWGSGRSTAWIAHRVAALTSIEHDPAWFHRAQTTLARRGLKNVSLRLVDPRSPEYVAGAGEFPDGSLDFALVDGLSERRDACAGAVVTKIRPGGLLIVDDVHRYLPSGSRSPLALGPGSRPLTPLWEKLASQIRDWPVTWTSDGVRDTAVWQRPIL